MCNYWSFLWPSQVTTGGDLLHDMDSVHKKPYEIVLIGQYTGMSRGVWGVETRTSTICSTEYQDTCDSPPPSKKVCLNAGKTLSDKSTASELTSFTIREEKATENDHRRELVTIKHITCKRSRNFTAKDICSGSSGGECLAFETEQSTPLSDFGTEHKCNDTHEQYKVPQELCQPFTFMCVASQTHSQKPYLGGIYVIKSNTLFSIMYLH